MVSSALGICRPWAEEQILYGIPGLTRRIFVVSSIHHCPPTMPPPFEHDAFHLILLPNTYFMKQLPTSAELPEHVLSLLNGPGFFSITRTPEEISIVGELTDNPQVQSLSGGLGDWRCIKIAGPMEFGKPDSLPGCILGI